METLPGMVTTAEQVTATVHSVRPLAENTWAVRVEAPAIANRVLPGQFFMVRPAGGTDPLLGRPFALFDTYCDASGQTAGVDFGFVVVGKLTAIMSHWQPGDSVVIWGPLGNGFPIPACRHLVCVAGGIGQTPFLAVAREALGLARYGSPPRVADQAPESVTLCYGVRSESLLAGLPEFELPGLDVRLATDDGTAGHHGYVTELLIDRLQADCDGVHVYCCGPEPMMKSVAEICKERSVPCWLSLETPMACGFGACFSCVTRVIQPDGSWDYRRTCVEGPVFRAETLLL